MRERLHGNQVKLVPQTLRRKFVFYAKYDKLKAMSSSCKQSDGSDAAEAAQRANSLTYSSGHLGPCSLNQSQPPRETEQLFWSASQSQEESPNSLALEKKQTQMVACVKKKENEASPSVNTSGTAFVESEVLRSKQDQTKDYSSHAGTREDATLTQIDSCSSNVLTNQLKHFSQKESNSLSYLERRLPFFLSPSNNEGLNNEDKVGIKQWLEKEVTSKQDIWAERNVAEVYERKLQMELKKLSVQSRPSRDRLAVFSDVFDDVCEGSPVFGRILREIKTDYDLYLNHLMSSRPSLHNMLQKDSVRDTDNIETSEKELDDAEKEVYRLEQEARRALEENKRLLHELQNTSAIMDQEDDNMKSMTLPGLQESAIDDTNILHLRRLQVLNVWKEIQDLEKETREKLVSTVWTSATERRSRDLKTERMKLIASNDRLRTISKDFQTNINEVLNREKASKTIRRMLWSEIHNDLQSAGE